MLVRAWKYLECGGNLFTVRYTGHKLSVEDLCTVAPSVLSVNVIFHELKYESDCVSLEYWSNIFYVDWIAFSIVKWCLKFITKVFVYIKWANEQVNNTRIVIQTWK